MCNAQYYASWLTYDHISMISLFINNIIAYAQACLISAAIVTPFPIIAMTAVQCVVAWIWVVSVHGIYIRVVPPIRMLMLYDGSGAAKRLIQKLITRSEKYQIGQSLRVTGGDFDSVCARILDFEAVVLCDVASDLCG